MKGKKIISALVVFCMLFSCFSMGASAKINKKAKTFTIAEDGVVFEAENCTLTKAQGISTQKSKFASGGKFILMEEDWRNKDYLQEKAAVEFFIKAQKEGAYNVWVRYAAADDSSDSIFISLNGADFVQSDVGRSTGGEEIFAWKKAAAINLKAGESYNIGFLPRERNFRIDQILVTPSSATPSGIISDPKELAGKEDDLTGVLGPGIKSDAKTFNVTKDNGGFIIEAEDATFVEKAGFSIVDSSAASGKKAVKSVITLQSNNPNQYSEGGIEFNIEAEKSGTYYVWISFSAISDGDDSIFLSQNGAVYAQAPNTSKTLDYESYVWAKIASPGINAGEKYNIRILPREKGFQIDQIVVTSSKMFNPSAGEIVTNLPDPNKLVAAKVDTTLYPAPTIIPPSSHPRVLFTANDIDTIKQNMAKEENLYAASEYERLADLDINEGILPDAKPGTENINYSVMGGIEARAFKYALYGDRQAGREAVEAIINFMKTIDLNAASTLERRQGYTIFLSAEVYDWCHDLMSAQEKNDLVALCQNMASQMEIGWPPTKQGAVSGHGAECQLIRDLLAFSIAAYDEYPDMYQLIAGRALSQYISPRDFYYQSNAWHQGISYNDLRIGSAAWMNYIFKAMSGIDVIDYNIGDVYASYFLYMRRPDGQQFREGDTMENRGKGVYWATTSDKAILIANVYKNPYLKREIIRSSPDYTMIGNGPETMSAVDFLIINDPDLEPRSLYELPNTQYFGSPYGAMIARTGYNDGYSSPDVVAFMKVGEVYGANHNHLDSGTFQIYYKGILASGSGQYYGYGQPYFYSYYQSTIAHNGLLIYDPKETMVRATQTNMGGQRGPSREYSTMEDWMSGKDFDVNFAKVISHEYGPDQIEPEYSYIKGDITNAYSDKVSEVFRNMLFMPTDDSDYPGVFVVMDKVTATDKTFDKYWIMHSQQEPEINGNTAIIKRDKLGYNGMLVNQTLYPKNASVKAVGGEGHWNEFNGVATPDPDRFGPSSCKEDVTWRIDVEPTADSETDYFLNVMYVGDADKNLAFKEAELIETDDMMGTKILNKVCMFAKSSDMIKNTSFKVDGEGEFDFVVTGLSKGSYDISANGNIIDTKIASEDGNTIYFKGGAGEYTITLTDANALRQEAEPVIEEKEIPIKIRVEGKFIYSDVNPVIVNDRTLLPLRALFENIGADVSYDGETNSATATNGTVTVTVTEGSNTAYVNGEAVELDVSAMMINDRFMVPVRFISESMGLTVIWHEKGQMVDILGVADLSALEEFNPPKKYVMAESVTCSDFADSGSESALVLANNAADRNIGTNWAEEGDGRWLELTFRQETTISGVSIMFYQATTRNAYFSIEVSEDGENWTQALAKSSSDGKTAAFQTFMFDKPVKAKYLRYVGHLNSNNAWNSVIEIMAIPAE